MYPQKLNAMILLEFGLITPRLEGFRCHCRLPSQGGCRRVSRHRLRHC